MRPLRSATSILFLAGTLAACTYPSTTVQSVDARPRLAFANASPTASLLVNDVMVGPAAAYDGKTNVLRLTSGTHKVEVRDGGRVIYSQQIYLGEDMLRTINLPN